MALANQAHAQLPVSTLLHIEKVGDRTYTTPHSITGNAVWMGTMGLRQQIEGISLTCPSIPADQLQYCVHLTDYGWDRWEPSGTFVGTRGQKRAIEAIAIQLTGDAASRYDVHYRVHMERLGDGEWHSNGDVAGTMGARRPIEAIQVIIKPKPVRLPPRPRYRFIPLRRPRS
jgi:uncharacterized protein YjdB